MKFSVINVVFVLIGHMATVSGSFAQTAELPSVTIQSENGSWAIQYSISCANEPCDDVIISEQFDRRANEVRRRSNPISLNALKEHIQSAQPERHSYFGELKEIGFFAEEEASRFEKVLNPVVWGFAAGITVVAEGWERSPLRDKSLQENKKQLVQANDQLRARQSGVITLGHGDFNRVSQILEPLLPKLR